MMVYVFDQYSLQYMLEQFPRTIAPELWQSFQQHCQEGTIVSHREVQKSLDNLLVEQDSLEWLKANSSMFRPTTQLEANFLGEMMQSKELDFLNTPDLTIRRLPEAIPFLLSMAYTHGIYYVFRKNTQPEIFPKIKRLCNMHGIKRMEVEDCLFKLKSDV